jgi:hypothetical protein
MRQRRAPVEVIGLSFLDMICCAFGGVLVLYLLSDRADGRPDPVPAAFLVIEATIESNLPFDIGMRFQWGGTVHACFHRDCVDGPGGSPQWLQSSGSIAAVLRSKSAAPNEIQVALLGGTGLLDRDCVEVKIESGLKTIVALKRKDGFRGKIILPATEVRC